MSNYYKYILISYLFLCSIFLILQVIGNNSNDKEIYLLDEAVELKNELTKYAFSNFELNYICENNLNNNIIEGTQVDDNMNYSIINGHRYETKPIENDTKLKSYYFVDSECLLISIQIKYTDLIDSEYLLNLYSDIYNIKAYGVTYNHNGIEYIINQKYSDKELLNIIDNKKIEKYESIQPTFTISFFIENSNLENTNKFDFVLYKKVFIDEKQVTIGLSSIKESKDKNLILETKKFKIEREEN